MAGADDEYDTPEETHETDAQEENKEVPDNTKGVTGDDEENNGRKTIPGETKTEGVLDDGKTEGVSESQEDDDATVSAKMD